MKRKSIILLSSILAGSLLVGGAFAAYAVTDNADPFGFVATPGTYEEESVNYVTLEFGDKGSLGLKNIEEVEAGKNYKAGLVSLKSTMLYTGDFTVKLIDRTVRETTTEATKKLIDYVVVRVYEGDPAPAETGGLPDEESLKGSVGYQQGKSSANTKESTFELSGIPAGKDYAVYLSVDSSANIYMSQMADDKVYVEVDWAPKSGDQTNYHPVYFERPTAWTVTPPATKEAYVYAWTDTPSHKENAAFPGVKMNLLRDNIYTLQVDNNFTNLVFSAGDGNEEHKTADLTTSTGYDANLRPYWNGAAWAALPEEQVLEDSYSFTIAGGSPVAMTENTGTDKTDGRLAEYEKTGNTVAVGQQLAFKAGDAAIDAGHISYGGNVDSTGKVKVGGSVDIFLKIYNGTGENAGQLFYVVYVSYPSTALYFVNNGGWNNLYIYAWNNDGSAEADRNAVFPGVPLDTYIGDNEFSQGKFAFDPTGWTKIIISSGAPGQTVAQTEDIAVANLSGKLGIYLSANQDTSGHFIVEYIVPSAPSGD